MRFLELKVEGAIQVGKYSLLMDQEGGLLTLYEPSTKLKDVGWKDFLLPRTWERIEIAASSTLSCSRE